MTTTATPASLGGDCNGNLIWIDCLLWIGDDETGHAANRAEAAVGYAAVGVSIFPCVGKRPITESGFKDAAPDATAWTNNPDLNIGWPLPAGYWALDVDPRHGGDVELRRLEREHAPLPMTLRQVTGSAGQHWIFRDPLGRKVRQLAGFRPGLDTRCGGRGYLMVEPSVHPDTGRPYRWISTVAPVDAPAWLLDLVCEKPKQQERAVYVPPEKPDPATMTRRQRYAHAMFDGLVRDIETAPVGTRNNTLRKAWWKLAGFRDVLDKGEVRRALTEAAFAADGGHSDRLQREIDQVLR